MANPAKPTDHRVVDSIRTMLGLGGIIALVFGLLILLNPVKSGAVMMQIVAAIVALYAVGMGAVRLGTAIFSKSLAGWPRTGSILLGLLYLAGGIALFANLTAAATVLTAFLSILIGILWIVEGIFAFTTLKNAGHRVLTIIYGAISVIAGIVLVFAPLISAITLWALLGASMIILGGVQIVRAFLVKASD